MVRSLFPFLLQKCIKKCRFSTNVPLRRMIYHGTKARVPHTPVTASYSSYMAPVDYEAGLTTVGNFDIVESYFRSFSWLKRPSELEHNLNPHFFKSDIEPMWEDVANANGSKWVLTMKNN